MSNTQSLLLTLLLLFPQLGACQSAQELQDVGEQERYVQKFLNRAPEEQANEWRTALLGGNNANRMWIIEAVLQAHGESASRYIAKFVRDRQQPMKVRRMAVHLLANIDTFRVAGEPPDEPVLVKPYGGPTAYVLPDGARIGPDGLDALRWAASQVEYKDLREDARDRLGVTQAEFARASLSEQVAMWETATNESRGTVGMVTNPPAYIRMRTLRALLAEQAPESIPAVLAAIQSDKRGYIAIEGVNLLQAMDECSLRLRGSEIGKHAIEAALEATRNARQKRFVGGAEHRRHLLSALDAQFNRDEFRTDPTSPMATLARSLQRVTGIQLTNDWKPLPGVRVTSTHAANALMLRYWSYLTDVDPTFPSWGFKGCQDPIHLERHPLYEKKVNLLGRRLSEFMSTLSDQQKSQLENH